MVCVVLTDWLVGARGGRNVAQARPCAAEEPIRLEPSSVAKVGKAWKSDDLLSANVRFHT